MSYWGNIASFVGVIISIWVLVQSFLVKNEVNKLRTMYLFKERCPKHLKVIDKHLSDLNLLMKDFSGSVGEIEKLLSENTAELESISEKISDLSVYNKLQRTIRRNKYVLFRGFPLGNEKRKFYHASYSTIWKTYCKIQNTYTSLNNLVLDSKVI
jgi:hypothetical protein